MVRGAPAPGVPVPFSEVGFSTSLPVPFSPRWGVQQSPCRPIDKNSNGATIFASVSLAPEFCRSKGRRMAWLISRFPPLSLSLSLYVCAVRVRRPPSDNAYHRSKLRSVVLSSAGSRPMGLN